jgi:diguanylate cyclase (GGDEF)-like protein
MDYDSPGAEKRRQTVLDSYGIMDTPDEKPYEDMIRLAAYICEAPSAMISFLDRERIWMKATYGVPDREAPRAISFCTHAVRTPDQVMLVRDARRDPRFAENPLVTGGPKIRLYAGAPMVSPEGEALGTICVMDQAARDLSAAQLEALQILARQVVGQLELRRNYAALETANAKLSSLSLTDALTCIPNRRAFNLRIAEEEARARRTGEPLSLLLADIDNFKSYNDSFGHPAGDEALHAVAQMLSAGARPYDFTARYGGEEFAVILPRTNLEAAFAVAQRLCDCAAGLEIAQRPLTLSIGVSGLSCDFNAKELIRVADRALYLAKARGRNCVAI